MRSIREADTGELKWHQPRASERRYELRAGSEVLGTLRWQKAFGTLALAETSHGRWTFKRVGFWRPRVTVRVEGSDVDIARFEVSWTGGGTLRSSDERTYRWGASNIWQTHWTWSDAAGTPLVTFASGGVVRQNARVELLPGAADSPDLALLVTLGWYLLMLLADDTAAATVIIAAT